MTSGEEPSHDWFFSSLKIVQIVRSCLFWFSQGKRHQIRGAVILIEQQVPCASIISGERRSSVSREADDSKNCNIVGEIIFNIILAHGLRNEVQLWMMHFNILNYPKKALKLLFRSSDVILSINFFQWFFRPLPSVACELSCLVSLYHSSKHFGSTSNLLLNIVNSLQHCFLQVCVAVSPLFC